MHDIKYDNELDKYAKRYKLYISNELKSVDNDAVNHVTVKWKDITIVDIKTRGIMKDKELLKHIKRKINLIQLGV